MNQEDLKLICKAIKSGKCLAFLGSGACIAFTNHNKEVVFSFYIYPKGNIDRPDLKKSSRVELLDNLALRAILESEPFPAFPREIESSNLNISIHFKYIPEKNKHDS